MADTTPKYSEADVDRIVAKRVAEQQRESVVAELSKELSAIRKEISSANHIKRTIGKELARVATLIENHIKLPMHPGTAERFTEFDQAEEQFGLDQLTPDERAAFPVVVRTVLASQQRLKERRAEEKDQADATTRFWQMVAGVAAASAVIVSLLSATGFFTWVRVFVFHLHA